MALPPTIPTSFVPHAAGAPPRRFRSDFTNAFGFFAYAVLVVVLALAAGVFFFDRVKLSEKTAKDAQLSKVHIDQGTITEFIRLRDRLNNGKDLLKKHVAFSSFFSAIQTLLPVNVRFTSFHVSVDPSGAAKIDGSGIAKTFNTLADLSNAFAGDPRIKDAIFSRIGILKDNSVSFGVTATLDPALVAFNPAQSVQNTFQEPQPAPQNINDTLNGASLEAPANPQGAATTTP